MRASLPNPPCAAASGGGRHRPRNSDSHRGTTSLACFAIARSFGSLSMMQSTSTSKNEKADAQTSAISNSQSTSTLILKHPHGSIKAMTTVKRLINRDGTHRWSLTVERCPLCGKRHVHGGGDGPSPTLGHRVSHCAGDDVAAGDYFLVDASGVYTNE